MKLVNLKIKNFRSFGESSDAECGRILMILLEEIFEKLCDYLDGNLRWSKHRKKFTNAVLTFFSNLATQQENIRGEPNYLDIDYVWHYEINSRHLVLAGHPTGRKIDRRLAFSNLQLFIPYCKRVYDLIQYFNQAPI